MEEKRRRAPSRRRRAVGTFTAGVVAGGLAIGVGLAGLSAWSSATADPSAAGPAPAGMASPEKRMLRPDGGKPAGPWGPGLPPPPGVLRMGPGPGPGPGLGLGLGKAGGLGFLRGPGIHGEETVRKPGGGYQTLASQVGEVTSVSKSSIAVRSEDGYTRTYAVDDKTRVLAAKDGISGVAKGDRVQVLAAVEGRDARVLHLVDLSKLPTVEKKAGTLRKQIEERRKALLDKRRDLLDKNQDPLGRNQDPLDQKKMLDQKKVFDQKGQGEEGLRNQIEERRRAGEQSAMMP